MPTTIVRDVGPGRTYSTLQAWNTAVTAAGRDLVARDVVEVAELYDGNSGAFDLSGADWTTDATRYVWCRAASGHGHGGIFDNTKAYIGGTGSLPIIGSAGGVAVMDYTRMGPGISFEDVGGSGNGFVAINGINWTFDGCIFREDNIGIPMFNDANNLFLGTVFKNCAIYTNTNGQEIITVGANNLADPPKVYNCTLVAFNTNTSLLKSNNVNAHIISQNNYLKVTGVGASTKCYNGAGVQKGANDATSNAEATTVGLQNIALTVANFTNVTFATADFHLPLGSALIDQGADLTAQGVTTDYEGNPRVAPFDIGADEFVVATPSSKAFFIFGL